MAKRKNGSGDKGKSKKGKYTSPSSIEVDWKGIYATCVRGRENQCRNELKSLFNEYAEEIYSDELKSSKQEEESEEEEEEEEDIEKVIAKEIADIKSSKVEERFISIDLGCECVVFFRVKRPIVPSEFIVEICQDAKDSGIKKTRYTQRLTPVDLTAAANLEGLKRICPIVLKPHFHKEQDQKPMKFAIRPGIRNHNKLNRDEIIKTVAEFVGKDHGHSVDLKNYDKLIIVECFKNSLGMAVLDKFDSLERFNLQQIYEKIEK